jgi:EmrB/QacA subfamily drug resistance transporter
MPEVRGRQVGPRTAVLVTGAGVFLAYLDVSIVNVALPTLARDLHTTLPATSWVVTAYNVAFTALLASAGRLGDALGRRRVFITGILIFAAGSAVCAGAWNLPSLVAGRVVQGLGGAALVPISLALLMPLWPAERRATAVASWGAGGAVGSIAGPPLGGLLVTIDWRLIFLINIPIALAAAFLVRRTMHETPRSEGVRIDIGGVSLVAVAAGAAALAVTQTSTWGATSPGVLSLVATAVVAAILAIRLENRSPDPVLDLHLFRIRAFAISTTALVLFYFAFLGYTLIGVLLLQDLWGWSPLKAGLGYALGPVFAIGLNFASGPLCERFGITRVGLIGLAGFVVSLLLLAFVVVGHPPNFATAFLPLIVLASSAITLVFAGLTTAATRELPHDLLATGTGALNTVRQVGGLLGIATVIAILGPDPHSASAFRVAYVALAIPTAMAFVAALALRRRRAVAQPVASG